MSLNNKTREAHDRHFSTFTKHSTSDFENDFAPVEPCHTGNADDDRKGNDAGDLALADKGGSYRTIQHAVLARALFIFIHHIHKQVHCVRLKVCSRK